MHFSYTAKFVGALILAVGVNGLLLVFRSIFLKQPDKIIVINIALAIILLISILWMLTLLWGLTHRMLLWLRAGGYASFRASHNTSVRLFGKDENPRVRTLRIHEDDDSRHIYYVTRWLTVSKAQDTSEEPLNDRQVAALRSSVEEIITNARAHDARRVTV